MIVTKSRRRAVVGWRRSVSAVLLVVLFAATLVACARGEPGPPPEQTTEVSAWEAVLDQIQPDGTVTTETALAAFALAIGPVPGAAPPQGGPESIYSGTLAVHWILSHWDALDEEQREAVVDALEAPVDGGGSGGELVNSVVAAQQGAAHNPNLACQPADSAGAERFRAFVPGIESILTDRLGRSLGVSATTYISVNTRNVNSALMYVYGCGDDDDRVDGCTVHVNPRAAGGLTDAELRSVLFHEYVHCFMFDRFGYAIHDLPAWWLEGAPTWAMTTLGVRVERVDNHWIQYLNQPTRALQRRNYDGLGFFVHLAETGTDPWDVLDPIGGAMLAGPARTFTASGWEAARVTDSFLDSWGSGFVQGRYPGTAWTSTGPALPDHQPALPTSSLGSGQQRTIDSLIFAAAVERVEIRAEVVTVDPSPGTVGRITLGGGADAVLGDDGPYCTIDPCACPEDSPGAGVEFATMASGTAYIGLSGGRAAGSVTLTGMSLADFCQAESDRAVCLVGDWTSVAMELRIDEMNAAGGAGVPMRIDQTGHTVIDFGGMEPINYTLGVSDPTGGYFTYTGTVSGDLVLPPPARTSGTWEYASEPTFSGAGVRLVMTTPQEFDFGVLTFDEFAGASGGAAGGPMGGGQWSCTGDRLLLTNPEAGMSWTFARTGR